MFKSLNETFFSTLCQSWLLLSFWRQMIFKYFTLKKFLRFLPWVYSFPLAAVTNYHKLKWLNTLCSSCGGRKSREDQQGFIPPPPRKFRREFVFWGGGRFWRLSVFRSLWSCLPVAAASICTAPSHSWHSFYSLKYPCDYIGLTWIIRANLLISKSLTTSRLQNLFGQERNTFTGLGCSSLWYHYCHNWWFSSRPLQ